MALTLEQKKAVVEQVAEVARTAHSAVGAEYRGLNVAEMTRLRDEARQAGVYVRVVRNTLARRAVATTPFACMDEGLTGPLVLAFSLHEPSAAARVMRDFAKHNDKLAVRLVAVNGKLLDASAVETLAALPTREQAIATLLAVMKAPVSKFVRTLAEPYSKLVRTLAAVGDQKRRA